MLVLGRVVGGYRPGGALFGGDVLGGRLVFTAISIQPVGPLLEVGIQGAL